MNSVPILNQIFSNLVKIIFIISKSPLISVFIFGFCFLIYSVAFLMMIWKMLNQSQMRKKNDRYVWPCIFTDAISHCFMPHSSVVFLFLSPLCLSLRILWTHKLYAQKWIYLLYRTWPYFSQRCRAVPQLISSFFPSIKMAVSSNSRPWGRNSLNVKISTYEGSSQSFSEDSPPCPLTWGQPLVDNKRLL